MRMTFLFVSAILAFTACKKDTTLTYDPSVKSELTLEFDNVAGDKELQLNTGTYTNASGEQFSVSLLQYFISNISLTTADGRTYTVPQLESYFLVKEHDAASQKIKIQVPEGEYKSLTFMIGVDSLRSTKPIAERPGVLDPANYPAGHEGMYWSWNSGYIFYKMEGTSAAAPADPSGNKKYRFHIGLFGGMTAPTINNIKTKTIDLSVAGTAKVKTGRMPTVHIVNDILKTTNGSVNISFATNSTIMVSPYSVNVANNYVNGFTHHHTHND